MKQIITYTYSFAVKQVSHQDFNTSLLHYKFRLIFMKAKKKSKWPTRFSTSPILNFFSRKFQALAQLQWVMD